jgi:hypothetical protein
VWGPWIGGRRGEIGRSAEGVIRIELKIAVVVPFLEREHEALIVKQFRVELVLSGGGDQDDLVVMNAWGS